MMVNLIIIFFVFENYNKKHFIYIHLFSQFKIL